MSAPTVNRTVQHDTNLVLGGFKYIIQIDSFNLATISGNTILTILKVLKYITQLVWTIYVVVF